MKSARTNILYHARLNYDLCEEEMDYAAVADGSRRLSVTRVDVTESTMTVTTFIRKTDGSLSVLDSYEVTK